MTDPTAPRLRLEPDLGCVALAMVGAQVWRTRSPDDLERLAHLCQVAAWTLRRHLEHGEIPIVGHDPHRPGIRWIE